MYNNFEYDYTISSDNSPQIFNDTCKKIGDNYSNAIRKKMLVDVDGTTIQEFLIDGKRTIVYDDYDIGIVFVQSEVNLDKLLVTSGGKDD